MKKIISDNLVLILITIGALLFLYANWGVK